MNRNINLSLGAWFFLFVIAWLAWLGGYVGEDWKTIIGMTVAAGLGLFVFTINTPYNKWLGMITVFAFVFYLLPFFWFPIFFTAPHLSEKVGETITRTQRSAADLLTPDQLKQQRIAECEKIMLAAQRPFLEGLAQIAEDRVNSNITQEQFEQKHRGLIAQIKKVQEQHAQCKERLEQLFRSASSKPTAPKSAVAQSAWESNKWRFFFTWFGIGFLIVYVGSLIAGQAKHIQMARGVVRFLGWIWIVAYPICQIWYDGSSEQLFHAMVTFFP